jgi:uncharacterized surface protein with fasciclin (FAS1) repeats
MKNPTRAALASLALLALAGCGDRAEKTTTTTAAAPAAPNRTLAAVLGDDRAHGALSRVAANAGLAEVLEGVGPYTVLAPPDAAVKGVGGADLTDPALKAEGAALLRAHVLPGALTRADIASAIDRGAGKGAQMRTMAGGLLTFTRSGEAIVVTAPDGASARLTGEETLASNGVLQPVDGLLVKPTAAAD